MSTKNLTREEQLAVKKIATRLRERFPHEVRGIKLYGSKARGEAHAQSDVDLLILVTERTKTLDEATIEIVCDVLNEYGVFLETVTMTESDYRHALQRQYPFTLNVEHDAVSV